MSSHSYIMGSRNLGQTFLQYPVHAFLIPSSLSAFRPLPPSGFSWPSLRSAPPPHCQTPMRMRYDLFTPKRDMGQLDLRDCKYTLLRLDFIDLRNAKFCLNKTELQHIVRSRHICKSWSVVKSDQGWLHLCRHRQNALKTTIWPPT